MVRFFIYLHLVAVISTALAAHIDQSPGHRSVVAMVLMILGLQATLLFPLYPIASLVAICAGAKDRQQETLLILLVFATTAAHCIAALPLVS